MTATFSRVNGFCERFGLQIPILLAPMAGACPPALSIAVMRAGGMGGCGAVLMSPDQIRQWSEQVCGRCGGAFNLNLWIPDSPPARNAVQERLIREFLADWGPELAPEAGDVAPPEFALQCEALLAARPRVASSIMGVFPRDFAGRLKTGGISWFATVSTLAEARAAETAGADVIVAQGMEAGGHRGSFDPARAEHQLVGLMALLPAIVDAVRIPVVATGGIGDGRGVAAALALGASAVQVGTAFLRCPEADIPAAWAAALAKAAPENTIVSRAFSGRPGRSLATDYARAATDPHAPLPAPYPVQRGLTAAMRAEAIKRGDVQRMQAWAGQAAALGAAKPAGELARELWEQARRLLA